MLKFQLLILQIKSEFQLLAKFWDLMRRLNHLTAINGRSSTFLVLMCWASYATVATGQTLSTSQKFALGIKAAPHFTVAHYRDKDLRKEMSPGPMFGYTVGGQIKFPLKDNYSFFSEVGFAQKGRNTEFDVEGRNRAVYYFLDGSMALRKQFNVKVFKNVPTNLYFNVGPNIEYWLGGNGTLSYNPGGSARYKIVLNEEPTSDFSKYYYTNANRWLFGIDFGLGGDAPLVKNQKIYYEFRTTVGQTQLGKKGSVSSIELVPRPNDNLLASLLTFQFQLTYAFEFDTRETRKGKSTEGKDPRIGKPPKGRKDLGTKKPSGSTSPKKKSLGTKKSSNSNKPLKKKRN
jgi:hypothetical protein